ncbi:hypothetical protein [Bradyrhizobium sp. BWA-3-5]|jgi:hypothetical protein|nr:hypothetical protein [Bradyrhizobium sp. BWA-3-5]WOH69596.1 hypothetical protein RX331_18665 [Bradyrhizobium sp. BWA-3-5]
MSNSELDTVRRKWMIANYLVAIGVATAGWICLLAWIVLQFI